MNPLDSTPPERPPAGRGPWWEPGVWFAGSLCLYILLAQAVFYKTDGPDIARLLDAHLQTAAPLGHPWHVGFLPALDGFRRLLAWGGIEPGYVQLGDWFSALGAALGVAFSLAGCRRLVPVAVARTAVLVMAVCPGILLFATVVEYHGPLLAPLGLAFWWTAVQIGRPSWVGMLGLGGLCHLAFLMHGQALFYPVWLLAFFVVRRWSLVGNRQRDLVLAGLAGACHAGLWLVLPRLLPGSYGMWADLATGLQTEASIGRPQSLDYTPAILWQEWLWPLLPVSVLVLAAPLQRALRAEFGAFLLGLLPFLYISVRQLVFEPEYGAYVLPMVLPASLLVAEVAGTRWRRPLLASLLVGLLPIVGGQRTHLAAQCDFDAAFAEAVTMAAGTSGAVPFVLVGSHREMAAAYACLGVLARRRDPLTAERFLWVRENATMPRERATPEHFVGVEAYLRALHAAGRPVLITSGALASLDDPRAAMLAEKPSLDVAANATMAGPLFAQQLRQRFELLPAAPGMLRLVPKP